MDGSEVERYGFGLGAADSLAYFFVNLLSAYGGDIFNEDGTEVAFNDEAPNQAAQLIAELAAFERG